MENRKINIDKLATILSYTTECYKCPIADSYCDCNGSCASMIKNWLTEAEEPKERKTDVPRMKIFYVSHPYTGDEEKNRKEARNITAMLKDRYPQYIFINPLDAMRYTTGLPYEETLEQCLELLFICDGIIMTGDWRHSIGCCREYQTALARRMDITDLEDWGIVL